MQNNYNKLINNLSELKLEQFKISIDNYLNLINEGSKSVIDALYELTRLELNNKNERAKIANVKVANFPFIKTFDDYDFEFQPSINKNKVLAFKYLRFLKTKKISC